MSQLGPELLRKSSNISRGGTSMENLTDDLIIKVKAISRVLS